MELFLYTKLISLAKSCSCKNKVKTKRWKQKKNIWIQLPGLLLPPASSQDVPAGRLCFVRVSKNGGRPEMFVHKFCPSYSILSAVVSLSWRNDRCFLKQTLQSTLWKKPVVFFFLVAHIARAFSELWALELLHLCGWNFSPAAPIAFSFCHLVTEIWSFV